MLLHLDSQFFEARTIRSLTYAAPFAAPLAYTELNVVPHQILQHGMQRTQLAELAENEPHHVLHLLVWIERKWPRPSSTDIRPTSSQGKAGRPPRRVDPAGNAPLEDAGSGRLLERGATASGLW